MTYSIHYEVEYNSLDDNQKLEPLFKKFKNLYDILVEGNVFVRGDCTGKGIIISPSFGSTIKQLQSKCGKNVISTLESDRSIDMIIDEKIPCKVNFGSWGKNIKLNYNLSD